MEEGIKALWYGTAAVAAAAALALLFLQFHSYEQLLDSVEQSLKENPVVMERRYG